MKKTAMKLSLARETLRALTPSHLGRVAGGTSYPPPQSLNPCDTKMDCVPRPTSDCSSSSL